MNISLNIKNNIARLSHFVASLAAPKRQGQTGGRGEPNRFGLGTARDSRSPYGNGNNDLTTYKSDQSTLFTRIPQLADPLINGLGVASPSNALSYGYYGTTYHSLTEQAGGGLEYTSGLQGFSNANRPFLASYTDYYSAFESLLEPIDDFRSYHFMFNNPNGRDGTDAHRALQNGRSELNSPYANYMTEIYAQENPSDGGVDNWRIFAGSEDGQAGLPATNTLPQGAVDDINSFQHYSPTDYESLTYNDPWSMQVKVLYQDTLGEPQLVKTYAHFDRSEVLDIDGYHWDNDKGSYYPQALPLYSQFGLPVVDGRYWEYVPYQSAQAYIQSGGKFETLVHSFDSGLVEPKKQYNYPSVPDSYEFMNEMLKYSDTERLNKTQGTPLNAGLGESTSWVMRQGDFLSEPAGLIYNARSQYTNNGMFNDAVYSPFYYTDAVNAPDEVRPSVQPGQAKTNGVGVDGHLKESPTSLGRIWSSFDDTTSYGGLETEEDELDIPAYVSSEAYSGAVNKGDGLGYS